MVDHTEPPVVSDAELANLTYEQLAQLINEGNPNDFYLEASAFDEATGRLRQLRDDFLRESRLLQGFVSGEILLAVEEVTRRHVGLIDGVLEPMLSPGYAQALRKAGDALANGQQRLRDLQAQNGQQDPAAPPAPEQSEQTRLQALQILRDIGTAYRDIGGTFGPLPDLPTNGNQSFGGPTVTNGQGPGNTPLLFVGGRYRPENTSFLSPGDNSGPSEVRANGGDVFAGEAPGPFAGGAPVVGGAFAAVLGRSTDSPSGTLGEVQFSRAAGESVEGAPVAALSAGVLSSGVLGRSSARATVAGNRRKENKREKDATATEDEAVLAISREEERPETVSTAVPEARTELTQKKAVPTVSSEVPKVQAASTPSLTVPAFDLRTATAGEGTVDPKERGMHAPAGAELSSGQPLPMITPMTVPMLPAGSPAPAGTPASGHGMGPMMPPMMMGGMRGAGGQDGGERFADVPVTPEAEVWDPSRATDTVLGRPDPEPSEAPEPCSEQEIDAVRQAAIDEILGKIGKRS